MVRGLGFEPQHPGGPVGPVQELGTYRLHDFKARGASRGLPGFPGAQIAEAATGEGLRPAGGVGVRSVSREAPIREGNACTVQE